MEPRCAPPVSPEFSFRGSIARPGHALSTLRGMGCPIATRKGTQKGPACIIRRPWPANNARWPLLPGVSKGLESYRQEPHAFEPTRNQDYLTNRCVEVNFPVTAFAVQL